MPRRGKEKQQWLTARKRDSERAYAAALATGHRREADIFKHAATQLIDHENPAFFDAIGRLKKIPVTIDEFMDSREFMGCATDEPLMDVWPKLRPVIREMNPDVFIGQPPVIQALMGGACHAVGTLILMYDGTRKAVEDIEVNDLLMGPDSAPRTVMSLARGEQEMFRITPHRGGEPFVVNRDHILSLQRTSKNAPTTRHPDNKRGETVNIRVGDLLSRSKTFRHMHKLRRHAVDFAPGCALPLSPYVLGLWLGDGDSDRPVLTSMDQSIIDTWCHYGRNLGLEAKIEPGSGRAVRVRLVGSGQTNAMTTILRDLGVLNNKHIPAGYLTSSRSDRLELLAGLIDTDGYCYRSTYEFSQKNDAVVDGIVYLARSLGFMVTRTKNKIVAGVSYHRIKISGTGTIPCRLARKQGVFAGNRDPLLSGFEIESIGDGQYYGFELDGDHLYLTSDFTRHHNTGWGKSHAALVNALYQVYLATCFDSPHRLFNLNKATTPIVFMFMSVSGTVTKRVLFQPFRAVFTNMRYSRKWLTWDKYKESELHLVGNILVVPALASIQSMVGQAIAGAIVDEINFMNIVENSKQVAGAIGQGGHYDQADIVWSNITRRRQRSFATAGISFGTLCAPSSTRYKGDYIDRKMAEADAANTRGVLTQRYKQYDIAPLKEKDDIDGKTFPLLVGTDNYATRVLTDKDTAGSTYPEHALVERVPLSYRPYFLADPEGAARDVIGIASNSITPFFSQRHKIVEAIIAGQERDLKQFIIKPDVVLAVDGMPQIDETLLPMDRETARFVHVDLSASGDATGIAMVKYDGHTPQPNPQQPDTFDLLPKYVVEMAVSIKPDSLNQIDAAEVRKWIMQLVTFHKLNIVSVSYDSWQSRESLGLLRNAGIASQELSVDKTSEPYNTFRAAIYDGRVAMVESDKLRLEMTSLEYLAEKDKIDHPPNGSKDISDAVCGALYACARDRIVRSQNTVVNRGGRPQTNENSTGRREVVRATGLERRS